MTPVPGHDDHTTDTPDPEVEAVARCLAFEMYGRLDLMPYWLKVARKAVAAAATARAIRGINVEVKR